LVRLEAQFFAQMKIYFEKNFDIVMDDLYYTNENKKQANGSEFPILFNNCDLSPIYLLPEKLLRPTNFPDINDQD
jgi:hypothetical protein